MRIPQFEQLQSQRLLLCNVRPSTEWRSNCASWQHAAPNMRQSSNCQLCLLFHWPELKCQIVLPEAIAARNCPRAVFRLQTSVNFGCRASFVPLMMILFWVFQSTSTPLQPFPQTGSDTREMFKATEVPQNANCPPTKLPAALPWMRSIPSLLHNF